MQNKRGIQVWYILTQKQKNLETISEGEEEFH